MAAENGSYVTLQEEEEVSVSSEGLTTAQAEAAMAKWGKNEIPEEKEPVSVII